MHMDIRQHGRGAFSAVHSILKMLRTWSCWKTWTTTRQPFAHFPSLRSIILSRMPVNPSSTPIHSLNNDILLSIFTMNADMFADQYALRTTRFTSQVCLNWRSLMLDTPTLWARLIDMGCISHRGSDKWRDKLMRRSGAAPLWIRANRPDPSVDNAKILSHIIDKNWHRIQHMVIQNQDSGATYSVRLALTFPAPQLQTFYVTVRHAMRAEGNKEAQAAPLFGGHAPMLRRFQLFGYVVDHRAPWLRHLHFISLDDAYNIRDALVVLSATHRLQELMIKEISHSNTPSCLPMVSLPHLKSLKYEGHPQLCTTFLDHVEIPLYCSLSISVADIYEDQDSSVTQQQILSAVGTFNRYARRFPQSNIFQTIHLNYEAPFSITLKGETSSPVECLYSIYIVMFDHHASNGPAMFFNKLALLDFSSTTKLYFSTEGPLGHFFAAFFSCLPSLDTIYVDAKSLHYLMALQKYIQTTDETTIIFPHLKVVEFAISTFLNAGYQAEDQVETAVKYVLSRARSGFPISVLDMTKNSPLADPPNLDALAEVKGLTVLYKRSYVTGIFELTCGSGDPEKHVDTI